MTKAKNPLLSFRASGSLANTITLQDRGRGTMVRRKPIPTDPQTLPQIYHRWEYQDYAAWWNTLSEATKRQWEIDARRSKMTGFNYFMRDRLLNRADIAAVWHLDERSGSVASDSSPNANHGTIYGATHVPGLIDYCLSFDGLDDFVACGFDPSLNIIGDITICGLVNPGSPLRSSRVFCRGRWKQHGYYVDLQPAGFLRLMYNIPGVAQGLITTVGSILPNTWYHFMFTVKDTQGKAYLNGVDVTAGSPTLLGPTSSTYQAYIGRPSTAGARWKGFIDHLIILNRAATAQDALRHAKRRYPA